MASSSKFVLTAQLALQAPTAGEVKAVVSKINKQLAKIKTPDIIDGAKMEAAAKAAARGYTAVATGANKAAKNTAKLNNITKTLQARFKSRLIDASIFSVVNAGIVAVSSAFNASIRSAISFERELARVGQVTGKTNAELADLTNTITKVSTSFGTSSSELLSVSRTLAQAGLSARETEIALKAIAATDLSPTFENMGKTAEGLIAIMNQFGTSVDEAQGVLSSINAVAGSFAVESGDLIEAVKRGGAAFSAAGGSIEEFIALFTSVRSTTREGAAQIATGLRTIFTRIQRPKTLQYFKELGVELTDSTGKFIGAFEATRRLAKAFGNLEAGDTQLIAVAEQLGGTRQVTRVLPLLQQFAKSEEALATAIGGTNSLIEDRDRALNTFAVRLQKVRESVAEFGRTLTGEAGILNGVLDSTAIAIQTISNSIKGLSGVLGEGTLAMTGLGTALGLGLKFLGGYSNKFSILAGAIVAVTPMIAQLAKNFSDVFGVGIEGSDRLNKSLLEVGVTVGGIGLALQKSGLLGLGGGGGIFNNPFEGASKVAKNRASFVPQGGFPKIRDSIKFQLKETFNKENFARAGETSFNAAGGAAVGVGSSFALAKIFGRTATALERFNKAVEKGTAEQTGSAAAALQIEKDLDNAGMVISGAAGAVAGAFLGPVAGQLVGAVTAGVTEVLFAWQPIKDFAAGFRDVLSEWSGGFIRSTRDIAKAAENVRRLADAGKELGDSLTAFDEAVKNGVASSQAFSEAFSDDVSNFLSLKAEADALRGSGQTLTASEQSVVDNFNSLEQEMQDKLGKAFGNIAGDVIRRGGSLDDALARLDPQMKKFLQLFGFKNFEEIFSGLKESISGQLQTAYTNALNERLLAEQALGKTVRDRAKAEEEARQIISDFGGADFTSGQREALILQRANAGAGASGISDLQDASPEALRKRAGEIGKALTEVRRKISLEDEGGSARKALEKQEKELLRLSKQSYEITKDLIDVRKRELEVIEAKNKREQDSLRSAIAGDYQKFFEGQAAQGATAAVALGDQNLAAAFGQSAIAAAFSDLQSMQQSGVNTAFGQQIGGAGGLAERAAQFGLAGVGINGGADIAAGTTPEQEAIRAEIRGLAGVLPAAAAAEQEAAQKQLEAADKQIEAARIDADRAGVAVNRASGGAIFRRRGTDTVPAMLTPGEFVVRKAAVQRGNNLSLLRAINNGGSPQSGGSSGGTQYLATGGSVQNGVSSNDGLSRAAMSFTRAANDFLVAVNKLEKIKIHVQLDTTNINVNLTGTSALAQMTDQIKEDVITYVGGQLQTYKASNGGQLQKQPVQSDLPSFT